MYLKEPHSNILSLYLRDCKSSFKCVRAGLYPDFRNCLFRHFISKQIILTSQNNLSGHINIHCESHILMFLIGCVRSRQTGSLGLVGAFHRGFFFGQGPSNAP